MRLRLLAQTSPEWLDISAPPDGLRESPHLIPHLRFYWLKH